MEHDDPMRVGDEDYMTPSQQFRSVMRDFDCIFSGKPLPRRSKEDEQAAIAYWSRILEEDNA
jgi:hypothetical protein